MLAGCAAPEKPDTSLFGEGTHTGTLYSYRVPPLEPVANGQLKQRFAPLRGEGDLRGFLRDGKLRPELVVTNDDLVLLSLDSAFIKYFKEGGGEDRKGEIVFVLSFDAGSTRKDSFVAYSSAGQTLGSFLAASNWPVMGPLKIDGSHLKLRLVMIELDRVENERVAQVTRSLIQTAGQLQPQLAPFVPVAQKTVDAIIRMNGDDVILDQRFALQRVDPESTSEGEVSSLSGLPLLYGKYVLVLQEDRLVNRDVSETAGRAVFAHSRHRLRFNRDTNRLYTAYDYHPDG